MVVLGVALVGYFFFVGTPHGLVRGRTPHYTCDTLLTPGPVESVTPTPVTTASPAPSVTTSPDASASADASASPAAAATPVPAPTPRLGFTTTILGRDHVLNPNDTIDYGFCPPTSGNHYNVTGRGPIPAASIRRRASSRPVAGCTTWSMAGSSLLYRCTGRTTARADAEMQQLQAFYDQAPVPAATEGCDKEVLVARFDGMDTHFAYLAWGRALLTNDFDLDTALTFARQWMDHDAVPEKNLC